MRSWHFVILLLGGLAATGCRSDPNVAIVERELRLQEDQIYQLQDCVDEQRAIVESCRRENSTLRKRLKDRDDISVTDSDNAASTLKPPRPDAPLAPRANTTQPPSEPSATPDSNQLKPPSINLPDIPGPLNGLPNLLKVPDKVSATFEAGRQVEKILLKRLLTGGYDSDLLPGDEGVSTVIEPHDANGNIVAGAAPISVVVLDPALNGEDARIARWDFTADEVARMYRKTLLAEGIHLEMMWPAAPPKNSKLHLFVRYTTPDGRKIETNRPIKVRLLAQNQSNWKPMDSVTSQPLPQTAQRPVATPVARRNVTRSQPKIERPEWSPNR